MDYSNTVVSGRVAKEPELKTTTTGAYVGNFSVATNRNVKTKDGYKDVAEFYNVICFGKSAENVQKYLTKGQQVLVSGQMQTRSWELSDGSGKKGYRTELVAERIVFGNKPRGKGVENEDGGGYAGDDDQFAKVPEKTPETAKTGETGGVNGLDYGPSINPEDIPF